MANVYGMKIAGIRFKDVGEPDSGAGTAIKGVQESFTITQADATITDIMDEFTDAPLVRSIQAGVFEFSFDIAGIDYAVAAKLTGGTWNSDTDIFELPDTASIITKKFKIDFNDGIDDMVIYKGQISYKFDGADLKTNPLKLTVNVTALVDETGFVDINTSGTARTTW